MTEHPHATPVPPLNVNHPHIDILVGFVWGEFVERDLQKGHVSRPSCEAGGRDDNEKRILYLFEIGECAEDGGSSFGAGGYWT